MLVTGALILIAAYFVHRPVGRRILTIPLASVRIRYLGVGVFPRNITLKSHQFLYIYS